MVDSMIDFRRDIDFIDREICRLLEKRAEVVKKIGIYKKERGLPIEDLKREKEIIEEKMSKSNLPRNFLKKFYELIFDESKRIQTEAK